MPPINCCRWSMNSLRRLAAFKMAKEAAGNTLQPTALVHEAWLRLAGKENQQRDGRAHFFGAAAEAMHRILIDRARRRRAVPNSGDQQRLDIQKVDLTSTTTTELLALRRARQSCSRTPGRIGIGEAALLHRHDQ
jgi:RNA polymerase sigma factor (TIGR02999 family)